MFINPFGLKNTWKLSVLSFYLCRTWFLSFSVPSLNAPKQLMVTHFLRYIEKFVSFLMETRLWRQDLNTHCDNQEYKIGWHMTCWVTLHCVKKNCRMTLNEHVGCICHTAFKLNFQIYLMATAARVWFCPTLTFITLFIYPEPPSFLNFTQVLENLNHGLVTRSWNDR